MDRRDLLLSEMGISQWVLTKPQVLKGDAQIHLTQQVKLVVVCEENHQNTRLFQDILRGLHLKPHEYQWLNTEQSKRIVLTHAPVFWIIQPETQAVKITKRFANQTSWQTPSWQDLTQPTQKRQLWQQMDAFLQQFGEIA